MKKSKLYCEGKTKRLYELDNDDKYLIQEFKDDVTAFNGEKHEVIKDKGYYCNQISSRIFAYLEKKRIKTHYIMRSDKNSMLVKKTKPILIECVIRKWARGSLIKRLGLDIKGSHARNQGGNSWITKQISPRKFVQDCTITELFYKDDSLGDPLINDDHAIAYVTDAQTLGIIKQQSTILFDMIEYYFKHIGFRLLDIKFEFGVDVSTGEVLLIDDISPEGCRLEDIFTHKRFDKDIFRFGIENVKIWESLRTYNEAELIGHNNSNFIDALKSVYTRIKHKEDGGRLSSLYDSAIYFDDGDPFDVP